MALQFKKKKMETLKAVGEELERAMDSFDAFNSFHEGYAVIKEELDELWEEVRKWKGRRPVRKDDLGLIRLRKEATQVAAMAVRFILDLTEEIDQTK